MFRGPPPLRVALPLSAQRGTRSRGLLRLPRSSRAAGAHRCTQTHSNTRSSGSLSAPCAPCPVPRRSPPRPAAPRPLSFPSPRGSEAQNRAAPPGAEPRGAQPDSPRLPPGRALPPRLASPPPPPPPAPAPAPAEEILQCCKLT